MIAVHMKFFAPALAALLLFTPFARAQDGARVDAASKGCKLVFSDEFNGTDLDRTKWIDSYPDDQRTHSNNEQQYYGKDGWAVRDGKLVFTAEKRSQGGKPY